MHYRFVPTPEQYDDLCHLNDIVYRSNQISNSYSNNPVVAATYRRFIHNIADFLHESGVPN